jgi:hypothetical protein
MRKIAEFLAPIVCMWTISGAASAQELTGSWTMMPASEPGSVYFALRLRHEGGGSMHSGSEWPVSAFDGLDFATRAGHDVTFAIARDAGRFDCEGYVADGEGAGVFRFTPAAAFARAMSDLGFGGIDDDEQLAMAVHDVSLDFARQMKDENLAGLDSDKLIAFRIFGVSRDFIRNLRREGLTAEDPDTLVAYRIHGVSPELVRAVKSAGIDADEEELVAFQIHGVSPELIEQLEDLGYTNLEGDELVAMRIHGVTPEFIADMKSRGLEDLTVDQLVALRIHGIN